MIEEIEVNKDHMEADLEQADMFLPFEGDTIDFDDFLTEDYKTWRQDVRMRGFRHVNVLSNKDTRLVTVIFCRCPMSELKEETMSQYDLKQAIMNRDGLTSEEADERIASFDEQVDELEEENAIFSALETVFEENFGLERDYLEEYLNKRKK